LSFSCNLVDAGSGVGRVELSGELDIATAPQLEQRLNEALSTGCRRVVVDLRGLSFIDSTGLVLLARWNLASRQDGFRLSLVQGDDRIRRVFELTGLAPEFAYEPPG
jgi:anti-sigma B factor antagonist